MFYWVDGILLGAAQRLCDNIQRLTGLTKFTVEKWLLITSVAIIDGAILCDPKPLDVALAMTNTVLMAYIAHLIGKQERAFLTSGIPPFSPTSKASTRLCYFLIFGYLAFYFGLFAPGAEKLLAGSSVCNIAWAYTSACIPRPPSKSKMREWYDRALTALNNTLRPEAALIPVPVGNR